jgi:hypothetical protein
VQFFRQNLIVPFHLFHNRINRLFIQFRPFPVRIPIQLGLAFDHHRFGQPGIKRPIRPDGDQKGAQGQPEIRQGFPQFPPLVLFTLRRSRQVHAAGYLDREGPSHRLVVFQDFHPEINPVILGSLPDFYIRFLVTRLCLVTPNGGSASRPEINEVSSFFPCFNTVGTGAVALHALGRGLPFPKNGPDAVLVTAVVAVVDFAHEAVAFFLLFAIQGHVGMKEAGGLTVQVAQALGAFAFGGGSGVLRLRWFGGFLAGGAGGLGCPGPCLTGPVAGVLTVGMTTARVSAIWACRSSSWA